MRWQRAATTLLLLTVLVAVLGAACSGAAGQTIQQGVGGSLVFTPSTVTVKKNEIITVTNASSIPHTFTLPGQGIDVVNDAGQAQAVKINLPLGTYPFICRFHVSEGMKGTLTVTG